jgi:hypothetical protein
MPYYYDGPTFTITSASFWSRKKSHIYRGRLTSEDLRSKTPSYIAKVQWKKKLSLRHPDALGSLLPCPGPSGTISGHPTPVFLSRDVGPALDSDEQRNSEENAVETWGFYDSEAEYYSWYRSSGLHTKYYLEGDSTRRVATFTRTVIRRKIEGYLEFTRDDEHEHTILFALITLKLVHNLGTAGTNTQA